MESSFATTLFSFISIVPQIIGFIACCYYISKQVKADSILLIIGSGISLLLTIFYHFVMPYFTQNNGLSMVDVTSYYTIAGVIGFFAGICFSVGLFVLINNTLNANKNFPGKFPPNEFK